MFSLKDKRIWLLLLSLGFLGEGYANVGNVVVMSGQAMLNDRPLRKSDRIAVGDRLRTGTSGQVNIIMKDKSVLALHPGTDIRIKQFSFNPDRPDQGRSMINLRRGTLQYVSGLIGRSNPDRALVQMGSAQARVRGSFVVFTFNGNQINVVSSIGEVTVRFAGGSPMVVSQGKSGRSGARGQSRQVSDTSTQSVVMSAVLRSVNETDAKARQAAVQSLTEAEKVMVAAVVVADATQLGASTEVVSSVVKAVASSTPAVAPVVTAVAVAVAKETAVVQSIVVAVKSVPDVDEAAVEVAAEQGAEIAPPSQEATEVAGEATGAQTVESVEVIDTPATSGGDDTVASPSRP